MMISSLVNRQYFCNNPEETQKLGCRLAQELIAADSFPCIVLLCGDLGTGKTVFSKGVAQGLGIAESVQSPTFPILLEYSGTKVPLYHFDLYRLGGSEEFDSIGGEDILFGGGSYGPGICLIEWPERLGKQDFGSSILCVEVDLQLADTGQPQSTEYQRREIWIRPVVL